MWKNWNFLGAFKFKDIRPFLQKQNLDITKEDLDDLLTHQYGCEEGFIYNCEDSEKLLRELSLAKKKTKTESKTSTKTKEFEKTNEEQLKLKKKVFFLSCF